MAKKGVDLGGSEDANVALNPIVGLAREDILGAVSVMLRETASKPSTTIKHARMFTNDVVKILTNKSEIAPGPKDKRFLDAAWTKNPFYRMGMQYYLAAQHSVERWIADLELDELERARANFVSGMIIDSLGCALGGFDSDFMTSSSPVFIRIKIDWRQLIINGRVITLKSCVNSKSSTRRSCSTRMIVQRQTAAHRIFRGPTSQTRS